MFQLNLILFLEIFPLSAKISPELFYLKVASLSQPHAAEMELVKQAKQDLSSFAILYERYFEKIYKFFHFRLRDQHESEDLTSITFEKAVKKLHTFEDQGYPFSTWLFRIAHNVLVDHFRKIEHNRVTSWEDITRQEEPFTELNPQLIDNKEALEKVKEAISTLPKLHQDIWALKLSHDMSNKEIAVTLNLTSNNVNVILFRSLNVIKNHLKRYRF